MLLLNLRILLSSFYALVAHPSFSFPYRTREGPWVYRSLVLNSWPIILFLISPSPDVLELACNPPPSFLSPTRGNRHQGLLLLLSISARPFSVGDWLIYDPPPTSFHLPNRRLRPPSPPALCLLDPFSSGIRKFHPFLFPGIRTLIF